MTTMTRSPLVVKGEGLSDHHVGLSNSYVQGEELGDHQVGLSNRYAQGEGLGDHRVDLRLDRLCCNLGSERRNEIGERNDGK